MVTQGTKMEHSSEGVKLLKKQQMQNPEKQVLLFPICSCRAVSGVIPSFSWRTKEFGEKLRGGKGVKKKYIAEG